MIFTVAVDGPAAAGKGTISRALAERFGFVHLDTGLLYRAVGARGGDPVEAARGLGAADLARGDLRTLAAGQAASRVAAIPEVRAALTDFQRSFARTEGGAVLDGRDIGTVICPDAEVKLYVTASPEVRAHRRWLEVGGDPARVLAEVVERDKRDSEREAAPLRPASDAIVIDTSGLSIDEAVERATALIGAALVRAQGRASDIVLHLPDGFQDSFRKAPFLALYARVAELLEAHGRAPVIRRRTAGVTDARTQPADGDLHLVEGGRARGQGWLNGALAYLPGYWHLSPSGTLADRPNAAAAFDPQGVDPDAARAFADGLRALYVRRRRSRYKQPAERRDLPEGCIAVFLQGPMPEQRKQAHLSTEMMLAAVVDGSGGRPVVVKPHPIQRAYGQAAIAALADTGAEMVVTDANVHDMLAACAVTVSINSAAAIEGMLHAKPAILFGRSDFAPLVETVTTYGDFPSALARALATPRDFDLGLYWYFSRYTLDIRSPGWQERILAHLARHGFPPERLGLA